MPSIKLHNGLCLDHNDCVYIPDFEDIELIKYNPLPAIKAPLSVGN